MRCETRRGAQGRARGDETAMYLPSLLAGHGAGVGSCRGTSVRSDYDYHAGYLLGCALQLRTSCVLHSCVLQRIGTGDWTSVGPACESSHLPRTCAPG